MEMQTADFLKLTRAPVAVVLNSYTYHLGPRTRTVCTHWGPGRDNQTRILEDQFPVGYTFRFSGFDYVSMGIEQNGFEVSLKVLGNGQVLHFSTRLALSLALQVSVEQANRYHN